GSLRVSSPLPAPLGCPPPAAPVSLGPSHGENLHRKGGGFLMPPHPQNTRRTGAAPEERHHPGSVAAQSPASAPVMEVRAARRAGSSDATTPARPALDRNTAP